MEGRLRSRRHSPTPSELLALLPYLSKREREEIDALLSLPSDRYCPHEPHPKQAEFLTLQCLEAFYGGAAGGGKSDALLMAALEHVDKPGYSALILRRTYADLALPGAIMDRAKSWLIGTDGKWNEKDKKFTFPSGATIIFGYLETENDKYRYQGAEFQFIAFDELTQFTESQYRYLFSRLRRLQGSKIPLRIRSASNPGGEGHEWVKARFVMGGSDSERIFVSANLHDNPSLDAKEYESSLEQLDDATRMQLLSGDWDVIPKGPVFDQAWFKPIQQIPTLGRWVRYWDLATSVKQAADSTAGALVGMRANGTIVIAHMARWKREWPDSRDGVRNEQGHVVEPGIIAYSGSDYETLKALIDPDLGQSIPRYQVGIEAVGMQLALVQDIQRNDAFLRVPLTWKSKVSGDKKQRASTWAARAKAGLVEYVVGPWNSEFFFEVNAFDGAGLIHDDQVDAVSGAVELLYATKGGEPAQAKLVTAGSSDYYKLLQQQQRIRKR